MPKQPTEEPSYSVPDRHAPKGDGTMPDGSSINGNYKQPWVEHDGVCDPTGDEKIG